MELLCWKLCWTELCWTLELCCWKPEDIWKAELDDCCMLDCCSKLELDWLKLELEACWLIELLCMLDSEQKNTGHEVDLFRDLLFSVDDFALSVCSVRIVSRELHRRAAGLLEGLLH